MLLKHFSWGYTIPPSLIDDVVFHNLYRHFYLGFFVDFEISHQYVQTCITYSWNNVIA